MLYIHVYMAYIQDDAMHIYICITLFLKNLLLKKNWNTVVAETVLLHYTTYPLNVKVVGHIS